MNRLWSFGTGNPGVRDRQLFGPHMAEENPHDPDEIVVAEQWGADIVLINRRTGNLRVLYGERGVPGDGERINISSSAHFMPSGPYEGHVLITEFDGEHRVMIVDRDSGGVMWCYTGCQRPFEAIYWDDDHIMVSDGEEIIKILVKDQTVVWNYPAWRAFYLQKLLPKKYGVSYGGDLLIPFVSGNPTGVWEIDTSTGEKVWSAIGRDLDMATCTIWFPERPARCASAFTRSLAGSPSSAASARGSSASIATSAISCNSWRSGAPVNPAIPHMLCSAQASTQPHGKQFPAAQLALRHTVAPLGRAPAGQTACNRAVHT